MFYFVRLRSSSFFILNSVVNYSKAKMSKIFFVRKLNVFLACSVYKIFAMRTKCKTIAQFSIIRIPISSLKIDSKFYFII